MGMDAQVMTRLQEGADLVGDLVNMTGMDSDSEDTTERTAKRMEYEGRKEAHEARRRARLEADEYSEEAEARRAEANADWGSSNIAMSGSAAMVRDINRYQDQAHEDDIRFEGEMEAREALAASNTSADLYRDKNASSSGLSMLSQGADLFKIGE